MIKQLNTVKKKENPIAGQKVLTLHVEIMGVVLIVSLVENTIIKKERGMPKTPKRTNWIKLVQFGRARSNMIIKIVFVRIDIRQKPML